MPLPPEVAAFLKGVTKALPMDVLRTAVSMLSLYDPLSKDMSPEANHKKAIKLMAQTATIVTTFDRLRNGQGGGRGRSEARLRREFPLHADRQQARTR